MVPPLADVVVRGVGPEAYQPADHVDRVVGLVEIRQHDDPNLLGRIARHHEQGIEIAALA